MISYNKLWELLKAKEIPRSHLKRKGVVVGQSYSNLTAGESITMATLNAICRYLNCQPGDVLEYIPDDDNKQEPGENFV